MEIGDQGDVLEVYGYSEWPSVRLVRLLRRGDHARSAERPGPSF